MKIAIFKLFNNFRCCLLIRYKSGFTPPGDIKFEDLSKLDPDTASPSEISSKVFNHHTLKSTISASKLKKRPGFFWMFNSNKVSDHIQYIDPIESLQLLLIYFFYFLKSNLLTDGTKEDFSDLPPNQRLKKLNAKILEIKQKLQSETAARDGLMKMKVVYEANSLLGDPMTVEGQLNESEHKLEKYKSELVKYQTYLEQANALQQMQHSPLTNRSQPVSQSATR